MRILFADVGLNDTAVYPPELIGPWKTGVPLIAVGIDGIPQSVCAGHVPQQTRSLEVALVGIVGAQGVSDPLFREHSKLCVVELARM